jgi:hypothetical protein
MFSWLFKTSPQQCRKDYSWPITPLPLWTKPVISKEMIEKIREECHQKELEKLQNKIK